MSGAVVSNDDDKSYAHEGTTAHKLAEMLVKDPSLNPHEVIGTVHAETGVVFDDDMWDGAVMYLDYITSVVDGASVDVEVKLPVTHIHDNSNVIIDAYSFNEETRHLHLFDYKYGFKSVEVYENLQLIHGLVALQDKLQPKQFTFHIVQPRGFHHHGPCRSWSATPFDVEGNVIHLMVQAKKVFSDNPECITGPHCAGCNGLAQCSTYRQATMSALDFVAQAMPLNSTSAEEEAELVLLIRADKIISERKTTLEQKLKHRLMRGESVTGFELKQSQGHKAWTMDSDTVLSIGEAMGIDLLKEKKPVTPAEAVRRGFPKAVIEQYTSRPNLGVKLHQLTTTDIQRMLKT